MGKLKNVMDYLYESSNDTGVLLKVLSRRTPEKDNERIVKLHNVVKECFYDDSRTTFELMITFDSRKWNVDAIDAIHRHVKTFLEHKSSDFSTVVMREFGDNGIGRVHYHGMITQIRGGQTEMAKFKQYIKNTYGRMSYVKHIRKPREYLMYMLKRTVEEGKLLLRELFSTKMIKYMVSDDDYKSVSDYSWEELLQFKRTKKVQNI